jgi:hypothetical protein
MSTGTLVAGPLPKIGRQELAQIPVPEATLTHKPVPHHVIVEALVETLSFRHIGVVNEEYAVSFDGMRVFGVLDLETHGRMPVACRLLDYADTRLATYSSPVLALSSPRWSRIVFGIILQSWHQSRETEDTDATQFFATETDSRQPVGVSSSDVRNVAAGKRLSKEDHSGQVVLAHSSWVVVRAKQTRNFPY